MPPRIEGADRVVQWFGRWPSFHDNHIVELRLTGTDCLLRIAAWEWSSEVDASGHLKRAKECRVSFHFQGVGCIQIEMEDDGNVGATILWTDWAEGPDGSLVFRWQPAVGSTSAITARSCSVDLEQGAGQ